MKPCVFQRGVGGGGGGGAQLMPRGVSWERARVGQVCEIPPRLCRARARLKESRGREICGCAASLSGRDPTATHLCGRGFRETHCWTENTCVERPQNEVSLSFKCWGKSSENSHLHVRSGWLRVLTWWFTFYYERAGGQGGWRRDLMVLNCWRWWGRGSFIVKSADIICWSLLKAILR